jgi:hypothetical protein
MAAQKRKSISIRGDTYAQMREWCQANDVPVGRAVDILCCHFLGQVPVDDDSKVTREPPDTETVKKYSLHRKPEPPAAPDPVRGGGTHSF